MRIITLASVGHSSPLKQTRFYRVESGKYGQPVKRRISRDKYYEYGRTAVRQDCMSTQLLADGESYIHYKSCHFNN